MKRIVTLVIVFSLLFTARAEAENFGTLRAANGKTFSLKIAGERKAYQLIVYSAAGKELGYYSVVDKPERIEGNVVIFAYAAVDGNVIPFKSGPPKEIELDTAQVSFKIGKRPAIGGVGVAVKASISGRNKPDPDKEKAARKRLRSRTWTRMVESFNQGWTFALADETKNEAAAAIPVARWRRVDLPHDWGVEHPVNGGYLSSSSGGFTKAGLGWYKKTFTVPNDWQDRCVYIDFGGVFMNSEVWINGHWLGLRPYGFSAFQYDLTPFLKFDASNEITVRVDNSLQRSARWYTGSGIYRDVNLVVTDPVHVDYQGTYVQTPKISVQEATVSLRTTVSNSLDAPREITVRTTVAGQKTESIQTVRALEKKEFVQTLRISKPKLWSLESPNLYTVVTEVLSQGKILDRYETPFGVRQLEFNAEKGFILNGKVVKLKGVCLHEDGGGAVGTAVPIDVWERRFGVLKEMGCNAVRCAHNPFRDEFYDLADRMGMLVIDEAFDEWREGKREHAYADYFAAWAQRDLKDMLRRHRNHPSIIMWSIGNEIRDIRLPEGAETAAWLCDIIKSMDGSRPTTIGLNHVPENAGALYKAIDHLGFNFAHREKPGSGHSTYDNAHKERPGRFIYGSETTHSFQTRGAYKTQTFRKNTDKQPNLTEREIFSFPFGYNSSYDNAFIEHHNRFTLAHMRDNTWLAGEFRWTGIDYLGEAGSYPARFKDFGIIDMCGYPKDAYYLYQSVWADKTVLRILPHWNWPEMEGVEIPVWIYASNCDEAELFLNGKSLGKKSFDYQALYASWNVGYIPGELKAVSYKGGRKVKESIVKTADKPAAIELVIDKTVMRPNHRDVIHAQVRILDAQGNFVPTANNRIKYSVSGPAKILGVDNGDPLDHDPLKADSRKAFHGMCLAVVQSGLETGDVVIRVESDGLKGAQRRIVVAGDVPEFACQYTVGVGMTYAMCEYELKLNVPEEIETAAPAKKKKKRKKK